MVWVTDWPRTDCIRCGGNGHFSRNCIANKTLKGTPLPKPQGWKPFTKRKLEENNEATEPPAKVNKTTTVAVSETTPGDSDHSTVEARQVVWAENDSESEDESDF